MAKNLIIISLGFACGFWKDGLILQVAAIMTLFPATESSGCQHAWLTGHGKEPGPIRVFYGSARIREPLLVLVGHELVTLDAVLLTLWVCASVSVTDKGSPQGSPLLCWSPYLTLGPKGH